MYTNGSSQREASVSVEAVPRGWQRSVSSAATAFILGESPPSEPTHPSSVMQCLIVVGQIGNHPAERQTHNEYIHVNVRTIPLVIHTRDLVPFAPFCYLYSRQLATVYSRSTLYVRMYVCNVSTMI